MKAKKVISVLLCVLLLVGVLPTASHAAGSPFSDVKTSDWFFDGVQYAYERGMMNGTGGGKFSPDATTTRGMIVTILYRLEGSPAASGTAFTDVARGNWYSDAVSWASSKDIVNGYGNGKFGPEDTITREQMAAILYRYANYKGYDVSASTSLNKYHDFPQISSYAVESMAWANAAELINGMSSTILSPKGSATRAQVALILKRFCENVVVNDDGSHSMSDVENAYAKYEVINDYTNDLEAAYTDENGCVDAEEAKALLNTVSKYAEELYRDGLITHYAYKEGDTCVYMKIDGWLGYCYSPTIENTLSGGVDPVQIVTFEPFAYEIRTTLSHIGNGFRGPDDAAEEITNTCGSSLFTFSGNYDDSDVSFVSLIENLGTNKIIMWNGHGGYNSEVGSMISLGDPEKAGNKIVEIYTNQKLFDDDSLITVKNKHFCFTANLFLNHIKDGALEGSLIYLNACDSFSDNRLAKSLFLKGARCVVGNSCTIFTPYGMAMMYDFFVGLTKTDADGSLLTISEALEYAEAINGKTDQIHGAEVYAVCKDDEEFTLLDMVKEQHGEPEPGDSELPAAVEAPDSAAISISSAQELHDKLEQDPSGSYVLTNDIDLSTYNGGVWIPLCEKSFQGTLDGQGHKIRNLNIPETQKSERAGLFVGLGSDAVIKNLLIEAKEVYGTKYAGVVSAFGGGLVYNCKITCPKVQSNDMAGGVFALFTDTVCSIQYVDLDVTINTIAVPTYSSILRSYEGDGYAGGVIGEDLYGAKVTISHVSVNGSINAADSGKIDSGYIIAGGMIGHAVGTTEIEIVDSTVTASITATASYGGRTTSASGSAKYYGPSAYAGGLIGDQSHSYGSLGMYYDNTTVVDACTVSGEITANSKRCSYAGGLAASNQGMNSTGDEVTVKSSTFSGSVKAIAVGGISSEAGGVFGYSGSSVSLQNCTFALNISAKDGSMFAKAGKICGDKNDRVTLNSVTDNSTVTATNSTGKVYIDGVEQ